jgi:hypothetical protein
LGRDRRFLLSCHDPAPPTATSRHTTSGVALTRSSLRFGAPLRVIAIPASVVLASDVDPTRSWTLNSKMPHPGHRVRRWLASPPLAVSKTPARRLSLRAVSNAPGDGCFRVVKFTPPSPRDRRIPRKRPRPSRCTTPGECACATQGRALRASFAFSVLLITYGLVAWLAPERTDRLADEASWHGLHRELPIQLLAVP